MSAAPLRPGIFFILLGFAAVMGVAWMMRAPTPDPVRPVMPGTRIGGAFSLTDQDGKTVTESSWPGKYRLVYFGFTYCPAICPTELQKMAAALKELGTVTDTIQPIFISVDPERDTPQVLKTYVPLFDTRLIGLTGTRAQIDQALKSWHVYAAKMQPPGASDYTMDHSSFTYLTDETGELLALYRSTDTASEMAASIRERIARHQRQK